MTNVGAYYEIKTCDSFNAGCFRLRKEPVYRKRFKWQRTGHRLKNHSRKIFTAMIEKNMFYVIIRNIS